MIPPSVMMGGAGSAGSLTAFTASTQSLGDETCGEPVLVLLDWTPDGSVTDDYEVKLYVSYSVEGYPSEGTDLIHTSTSPASVSAYTHTSDVAYDAGGTRWFHTFTAKLYNPTGVLLSTSHAIYSIRGNGCGV